VVVAQSPRLLYSATLGNSRDDLRNPNGVAALLHVKDAMNSRDDTHYVRSPDSCCHGRLGHNPVGVGELAARVPRVAEYSNPGLEEGSPSGKMFQTPGLS